MKRTITTSLLRSGRGDRPSGLHPKKFQRAQRDLDRFAGRGILPRYIGRLIPVDFDIEEASPNISADCLDL